MKKWTQHHIVYFIAFIIATVISLQLYWNIKNYQNTKAALTNEVISSLNTSVDSYYTGLAKQNLQQSSDTVASGAIKAIVSSLADSMQLESPAVHRDTAFAINAVGEIPAEIKEMMLDPEKFISGKVTTTLARKVIVALSNDHVDLEGLSVYLDEELKQKGFTFPYALSHSKAGIVINALNTPKAKKYEIAVRSRSAYLPPGSEITLSFSNINRLALKKSLVGMVLSLLLATGIIFSLIYLLRVIREQRQIALSKSDFVSNITHELKTPIATSLTALEGIQHFNTANDREKTDRYLAIQAQQLQKLNGMVEKILETAILESTDLGLTKEYNDIIPLLENITDRLGLTTQKEISLEFEGKPIICPIDVFHFENVVSNIVENAIKYGGNKVAVVALDRQKQAEILIRDNGTPITKIHREKIFGKFYRIPNNNRHDVKGYGIGLYYAKNIIEKHGGTLSVVPDSHHTIFKITVPYA